MKTFENKKNIKIVALVLILLSLFITIIPNFVYADEDEDIGGTLFTPVFKLFAGVGDLFVKGLQKIFIGDGDIKIQNPRKIRKR